MQDLQPSINQLLDFIKGIWLKKRFIIICSWLICPIGFLYVASLPNQYLSSATVYVDTGSPLRPILENIAIQSNPREEINMMAKTLLSRSNLETIARESDLDITARTDKQFNQLIDRLSDTIELESTGKDNIYTINFKHRNPNVAQRVVQETLELFVEGSLGNNRRDTDTAGRFLDEQIADYETRLSDSEQRLADFKRKYSDVLPLQGTFYNQLQGLRNDLETTQLEIEQTQRQIDSVKGQMSSTKVSDNFGVRTESDTGLKTRYDDRIKSLEDRLDNLTLSYTDQHPDVIETKALLAKLEDSRDEEIRKFMEEQGMDTSQPIGDLNSQLTLEVSRLQSNFASLKVKEKSLQNKIVSLESKIDLVPQIEAELASLNRDYGITKSRYEELLSRRESADLSRRAEVSAEEFQFRIIEPPLVPNKPAGPNRVLLYTLVLLVGFATGIGIAFLVNQLSPVLVRANQLSDITEYPVWGVVSHLHADAITKKNRTRMAVFAASSGVIVVMYGFLVSAEVLNIQLPGVL
ncbi:XrtA system polysaccharide chain length determinant [Alteromonas sp. ASW11-130]|uniref:XrtA system polysaccharide chain length determinant n=1 Tax=Alteromonas sp. ASW11-130 TaxID=3015775 RepID=UPI00224197DF|nr:XrtA system polysaccharide chain length determinant [Alteromonas sp. ASW11-130]MCW8091265.1 Wzz/FepE/Etk N-terminal domain-containing protein [Alteromonas sp. ASW11-130]